LASKGNQFKNKSVLIEAIHKMKQEKIREKQLAEQREARRQKNVVRKEKRINKKLESLGAIKKGPAQEKEVASQPVKKEEPVAKDVKGKSPTKAEKQQPKTAPERAAPKQ
jgi:large subunit ribosomal protein L19e